MRTIMLVAALLVGVARASGAEPASDLTVQFLRDACKQDETALPRHFCLGFLEGAGQVLTVNGYQHHPPFAICPPNYQTPSGAALIQSFMNWADKHPEHSSDLLLPGVAHAFQETWPCQESN